MNLFALNSAAINGSAEYTWYGSGNATIAMAPAGQGKVATNGAGAAVIAFTPQGNGKVAQLGAANALILLTPAGQAIPAIPAAGSAVVSIDATGSSSTAISADGAASIQFGGKWGIPNPMPVPVTYYPADVKRTITENGETRLIGVPADAPLLIREQRAAKIQSERRQA